MKKKEKREETREELKEKGIRKRLEYEEKERV